MKRVWELKPMCWEESLPEYIPTSVMVSLKFRNKQCFASYAAWKSSCFIETECSAWATALQIKAMNFDASRRAKFSYCMWFSLHSANGNKISLFLCSDVQVKGETSVHNEVFAFVIQSASVVLQSGMAHKVKNENGAGEENF